MTPDLKRYASIIALLVLISGVYSGHLNRTLWYDETFTWLNYAVDPGQALLGYNTPNNHLLHSFSAWITTSLIGQNLIGLRFTAFAAGLLAVAVAFRLGKRLGGFTVGLTFAALLATNYTFADYAVNARGYTLSILLALLLTEQLLFYSNRRRQGYLVMLWCGLLMMTMPSMILLNFSAGCWLLWLTFKRPPKTHYRRLIPSVIIGNHWDALRQHFLRPGFFERHTKRLCKRFWCR